MAESGWHTKTSREVLLELMTQPEGLTEQEASERLKIFGGNELEEQASVSLLQIFFEQFRNLMVLVLLAATLISGLLGEITDALTILVIVFMNAILGFAQQWRAERSLDALRQLAAPQAKVLRDGRFQIISANRLVPGDLVEVDTGDRIPADARIIESFSLETEESSLTGESLPVPKSVDVIKAASASLGDQTNLLFMGTTVSRGNAKAVVVNTGMATEMGQIAGLIQQGGTGRTPLEIKLNQLGQVLVYLSIIITAGVVIAGVLHGHELYEMFLAGVSLAVAAIPEGLPAIVTVALAIGVQRMIRRHAIVRKLPSVETLGCATVILSDKTGTLTQNQMTVTQLESDGKTFTVQGEGYDPEGRILYENRPLGILPAALKRIITIGLYCNHAHIEQEDGRFVASGDPTEAALLTLASKAGLEKQEQVISENPFDSDRKRMSVLVSSGTGAEWLVKGAPDVLLNLCEYIYVSGKIETLTEVRKRAVRDKMEEMAGQALRTLGFAFRPASNTWSNAAEVERDLVWVGMVGMIDPPRKEVRDAITTCKQAGIRTVMITGDHQLTAVAVAKHLGILPVNGKVVTGNELDQMDDRALEDVVNKVYVFARVSPFHKLRIVKSLQTLGHVVAMTGDGVNDAPAIQSADIGIAMGKTGTDVAREASDLILADDHFATIVAAVEEGRAIYDNIRKFIRYLLSSNVGEIVTMFVAMLAGLPLPLLPIQILWVNLVTDGLPAIALGLDGASKDIMKRPPRPIKEGIFAHGLGRKIASRGLLIGLVTLAVFYLSLIDRNNLKVAQTMAFATLVLAQLIHVFACRSVDRSIWRRDLFRNMWLMAAVASSFLLLLIVIYIPSLQTVFHTIPLSLSAWVIIFIASLIPTFAFELRSLPKSWKRYRTAH